MKKLLLAALALTLASCSGGPPPPEPEPLPNCGSKIVVQLPSFQPVVIITCPVTVPWNPQDAEPTPTPAPIP